jgi:hypothetical protein
MYVCLYMYYISLCVCDSVLICITDGGVTEGVLGGSGDTVALTGASTVTLGASTVTLGGGDSTLAGGGSTLCVCVWVSMRSSKTLACVRVAFACMCSLACVRLHVLV